MKHSSLSGHSGKASQVVNAAVAIAFIAFCAVIVVYYVADKEEEAPPPRQPRQSAKQALQPPRDFLKLAFYSSSAKKKWIDTMAAEFNLAKHTVGGKTVQVAVHHVNSGDSLDDLKEGKIKPDLWSPGDESWLHLASEHWREVKHKTLFNYYKPLVNIPLVIAMWEPMANALGYPKPIGWRDIQKLASNPEGWASVNRPEWGKFRWGHAHPDANSGFLAVISIIYAALGKRDGITPEDLRKPEVVTFLKDFEGAIEHYGLSNDWIDDLMHKRGPAYLSAAVQYENTIIESNEKNKNQPFKLVAIYPTEGAFWTQHPVAILDEQWVTDEKKKAARLFIDFLLGEQSQKRAMDMGLRPISNSIRISAPFDLEHGVTEQLDVSSVYTVPPEAVLKRIRDLWETTKLPATISLVLDRSGSMGGNPLQKAKEGVIQFVKSMKPRDQVEVVIFNHQVQDLVPFCLIRECGEGSTTRINGVFAEGETALYDAVQRSYKRLLTLQKSDPHRRYGMVILSDGMDNHSRINKHDFLDSLPQCEDFDAPKIYAIAYGSKADRETLQRITNRTNARLFGSSPDEIFRTYKELSANF